MRGVDDDSSIIFDVERYRLSPLLAPYQLIAKGVIHLFSRPHFTGTRSSVLPYGEDFTSGEPLICCL